MEIFKIILILPFLLKIVYSYRILAIVTHEGISHHEFFEPIVTELALKGHKVTFIGYYYLKKNLDTLRQIKLEHRTRGGVQEYDFNQLTKPVRIFAAETALRLRKFGRNACNNMLSNENVQRLMFSDETFDLILLEMFNSDCALGFVDKFKAPFIGMSSTRIMPWHSDRFGQPDNPAYIPSNLLWHGKELDFLDRVESFIFMIWYKTIYLFNAKESKSIAEKYFQKELPFFNEITLNASLFLINSHFTLTFAKPIVPGIIEVAGAHITLPKTLPRNIEKFINESEHGVIYFSLGSMIKGHTLPHDKRKAFLKVFSRLPQRVLWKWENESMPDKPDNVMIQKWMPQFDILSNPNVKAFISHGGLLGTTEAVHCGVPMVVMPQYGDQHTNAKAIEANGGGVILYLNDVNEDTLYESLQKILDPAFQKKAKELSERFRDRPMSPMDTAIYWVEYVARHKGAPHLRTAAVGMPLYQYLLLDVIGFLIAVLLIFMYITYKILSLTIGVVFRKKVKQS